MIREFKNILINVNSRKILLPWLILILAIVILCGFYLAAYFRDEITLEANGSIDVGFRVFYLENDIFEENPIPYNLFFLKSFTDFYEINSSFSASFSEELNLYYTYTATKRLVIRYIQTGDANLNPVVFEESYVLSEVSGSTMADSLNFYGSNNSPGGSYFISPRPHIESYLNFVAYQEQQMIDEGMVAINIRGFSAELLVDFTYSIIAPDAGLNEVLTRGYRIPLSTEIYSFISTGTPNFDTVINLTERTTELTLPIIILFVAVFSGSIFGLCHTLKRLMADPNEYFRELNDLLKKYSNEIVASPSLDLSHYTILTVHEFDELLKLAVNLNSHIMCCHNEKQASFATIVKKYAYMYTITNPEIENIQTIEGAGTAGAIAP